MEGGWNGEGPCPFRRRPFRRGLRNRADYAFANHALISSLWTISSLKVYAPDFVLRTILMTFVCCFPPPVCSEATVFFAMAYLISLWMVYLRRTGLNFLISIRSGVFFRFFVVT